MSRSNGPGEFGQSGEPADDASGSLPSADGEERLLSDDMQELVSSFPFDPALAEQVRDRFTARFAATEEVEMFRPAEVSLEEEVIIASYRRRRKAEKEAYRVLTGMIDSLIPPEKVKYDPTYVHDAFVLASSLAQYKRLQSVMYFLTSNTPPRIIIGSKDDGHDNRFTQVLSFNLGTKDVKVAKIHAGDLNEFLALPRLHIARAMDIGNLPRMDSNDHFLVEARNLRSIKAANPGILRLFMTKQYFAKPPDIYRQGLRFSDYEVRSEITRMFAEGRVSQQVVEEFNIPEHIADIASALGTKWREA